MDNSNKTGLAQFADNLKSVKSSFVGSFSRGGWPTSDKGRTSTVVNNFFLHLHTAKTHINTLKPSYTLGMGLISFFLLVIAFISGGFLMVYYSPSTTTAFNAVKDINFVVFGGQLMRNIHKWSGEAMIIFVILHMVRIVYTNSYKQGREFNWVIGIVLLILTFVLNLTGYMLPWDQLSYWALVIVANIAAAPKELTDIFNGMFGITLPDIGGATKEVLLGGTEPGQESLTRVYLLHILLLPLAICVFLGVHFFRIRKDGGLTRPANVSAGSGESIISPPEKKGGIFPTHKTYGLMELSKGRTPAVDTDIENTVTSWPNLFIAEIAVFMFTLAAVVAYSYFFDAPLKEYANPMIPENPAKAPWYFLGLQELVSYSAFMGGQGLPGLALAGLIAIPFLDRENRDIGIWFTNKQGKAIAIESFIVGSVAVIGTLAFVVTQGWFREWWPEIHQLWIVAINPGNLLLGFVMVYTLWVIKRTNSTRMGAISLITFFLVCYVILTYTGTVLRGPNWVFYWSPSDWPIH
ncbi:MAG: cytochrome b N-terminal domain-containing protein [Nitrospira sp.]|nr:cytochrome b N-terminal domain-containing protein [bacterium]MBL7048519.1 cytochrome b N-terminal domain-containing protein [Nitrospira sp.]